MTVGFDDGPAAASSWAKYAFATFSKLVTTLRPTSCSAVWYGPRSGTWTCSLHLPKLSGSFSSIRPLSSASAIMSWPVMPRSMLPSPTKRGMSAAGKKTLRNQQGWSDVSSYSAML